MTDYHLGVFALPSDAQVALTQLASDAAQINTGVSACSGLDATTRAEWNTFYSGLQTFAAQKPVWFFPTGANEVLTTGYLSENILQNQQELVAWKQKLSAKCTVPPSIYDPNSPKGDLLGSLLGKDTVLALQNVAAAAAVVAAAYLGTKIITLIPSARLRARTARERERTTRTALRRS